jgi:hypothetical protein
VQRFLERSLHDVRDMEIAWLRGGERATRASGERAGAGGAGGAGGAAAEGERGGSHRASGRPRGVAESDRGERRETNRVVSEALARYSEREPRSASRHQCESRLARRRNVARTQDEKMCDISIPCSCMRIQSRARKRGYRFIANPPPSGLFLLETKVHLFYPKDNTESRRRRA